MTSPTRWRSCWTRSRGACRCGLLLLLKGLLLCVPRASSGDGCSASNGVVAVCAEQVCWPCTPFGAGFTGIGAGTMYDGCIGSVRLFTECEAAHNPDVWAGEFHVKSISLADGKASCRCQLPGMTKYS